MESIQTWFSKWKQQIKANSRGFSQIGQPVQLLGAPEEIENYMQNRPIDGANGFLEQTSRRLGLGGVKNGDSKT